MQIIYLYLYIYDLYFKNICIYLFKYNIQIYISDYIRNHNMMAYDEWVYYGKPETLMVQMRTGVPGVVTSS